MINVVEYVSPQTAVNEIFGKTRFLIKTPVMIQLSTSNELKNMMVKIRIVTNY